MQSYLAHRTCKWSIKLIITTIVTAFVWWTRTVYISAMELGGSQGKQRVAKQNTHGYLKVADSEVENQLVWTHGSNKSKDIVELLSIHLGSHGNKLKKYLLIKQV